MSLANITGKLAGPENNFVITIIVINRACYRLAVFLRLLAPPEQSEGQDVFRKGGQSILSVEIARMG